MGSDVSSLYIGLRVGSQVGPASGRSVSNQKAKDHRTLLVLLWLGSTIGLQANTINFASVGTSSDSQQYNSLSASLAITGHPGWASAMPGTSWVSKPEILAAPD